MDWTNIIVVVHVLIALAIIGLVLLQHGKGADMGSGFGGGSSGSLFGATGSANFLSRTTAVLAALFFLLEPRARLPGDQQAEEGGGTVMDRGAKRRREADEHPKARRKPRREARAERRARKCRSNILGDNRAVKFAHVVKLVDTPA